MARRARNVLLLVLAMVALFAVGFGIGLLLSRRGTTTAEPTTSVTPAPCVTATVVPGASLPKPATVTSNVYNATNRAGLARRTGAELSTRGFKIAKIANDPLSKTITGVGEIRYGPTGLSSAKLMSYYIVGAGLVADSRGDATIDVVLGDAYSGVAPQTQVTAALTKPTVVVSGPGCSTAPPKSTHPASPAPTG